MNFIFFSSANTEIKTWNHYSVVRMNFTSNKYCNIPFLYCWPGCLKCVFHETSFDDSYGKSVKRSLKVWKVWSRPMFCLKSFTMLTYMFFGLHRWNQIDKWKKRDFFYFVCNISNVYQHCNKELKWVFSLLFILEMIKKTREGLRILSNAMPLSPEIKCPAFWHENICVATFSVSN